MCRPLKKQLLTVAVLIKILISIFLVERSLGFQLANSIGSKISTRCVRTNLFTSKLNDVVDDHFESTKRLHKPALITKNSVVEYWHAAELQLGLLKEPILAKKSFRVRTASDAEQVIDAGQLITAWKIGDLSDDEPKTSAELAALFHDARDLLSRLSLNHLDLDDLWKFSQAKGKDFRLGSKDAAYWLFGLRNRRGSLRINLFNEYLKAKASYHPTCVQRVAGGLAIASENTRFKRVSSKLSFDGFAALDVSGGFVSLDRSLQLLKEASLIADIIDSETLSLKQKLNLIHQSHKSALRSIEALALDEKINQELPQLLKKIFQLRNVNPTAEEAKNILLKLGLWSESSTSTSKPATKNLRTIQFPTDALAEAERIEMERKNKLKQYLHTSAESPPPAGVKDMRFSSGTIYCVDENKSKFSDDAIHWDPEGNQLSIHIANVFAYIQPNSVLDRTSRTRVRTQYMHKQPLFMLPPTVLKALSFSSRTVNEAITVSITFSSQLTRITAIDIFQSIIPPVTMLSYAEANKLMEGETFADLQKAIDAAMRLLDIKSSSAKGIRTTKIKLNRSGAKELTFYEESEAHILINNALSLYTYVTSKACRNAGLALPTLLGQEARVKSGRTRFGTAPLRKFIDLLAQRQIVASIGGCDPMSKHEVASSIHELTKANNQIFGSTFSDSKSLQYEALAHHVRRSKTATGLDHAVVNCHTIGKTNTVSVDGLGIVLSLEGLDREWKSGESVDVKVYDVNVSDQHIKAEFFD